MFSSAIDVNNRLDLFHNPGTWLSEHGINILIIVGGAWLIRRFGTALVSGLLHRATRSSNFSHETDRKKRLATLESLIDAVIRITVWLVASIMIVSELGINTAPLLASAGIIGVALGIGAQSLIKDFVNGVFIIAENQYRVGDVVQLGTVNGTVQAITVRTTVLRDLDGNVHHIPNGGITVATNKTFDIGRINEPVTVPFDTDLKKLEEVVAAVGIKLVHDKEVGPHVRQAPNLGQASGFNELGLVVRIFAETTPGSQWEVRTALIKELQKALLKENMSPVFLTNPTTVQRHRR